MTATPVRVGIVGAGANTRTRHIPGFRKIPGVEIVGVVNRTPESSNRVAQEFDIPRTYETWQKLVEAPEIDAVMIGTWPNLHCEITCAALSAGKHVLTEARMARNADEAHRMLQAAQARPELVAQIVPSPFGLRELDLVQGWIDDGVLGQLRELVVIGANDMFCDPSQPLHWRQDRQLSGLNTLTMGILHETAMRWTPPVRQVFSQAAIFESTRPNPDTSGDVAVTVPDSLQVVTEMEGGARGIYHLSAVARFGPGMQLHFYGSTGTLKIEWTPHHKLLLGREGDAALQEVSIPADKAGGWRVEAEFIGAIRGEEQVRLTDFETGVRYMEFTEAVARSAHSGRPVELPLTDVV